MNNFSFFNFVILQIYRNKTKHFSIFIISTILIFILSSFLFISNSIQKDINLIISNQADFIIQKIIGGKSVNTPNDWINDFISINGVKNAIPRVYGRYFYEPKEEYFTIIGIDFCDEQIVNNLKYIVKNINIKEFLEKPNMLIGEGAKKLLDYYEYFEYYNFRQPNRNIQKVYIYDKLPLSTNIISSDMIIMDINIAKKILGIKKEYSTDILLNAPNKQEYEMITNKIKINHFDTRIIKKDDLYKVYESFFNYRSSIFLILYIIIIITFMLILFQRYSIINSIDKKHIGILRATGWSIDKIIKLKIFENIIIFTGSFILGINLAYIYIFVFNAPILSNIFLGFHNLSANVHFNPAIDFSILSILFLFFIAPIIASILIPVWKISTTEPFEVMK